MDNFHNCSTRNVNVPKLQTVGETYFGYALTQISMIKELGGLFRLALTRALFSVPFWPFVGLRQGAYTRPQGIKEIRMHPPRQRLANVDV